MRIAGARLYRQFQPFAAGPYTCRSMTETGFQSAIVAIEAEDGTVGWGETAPLGSFYSEAFPDQIYAGIEYLLPTLEGFSATAPARLVDVNDKIMFGQPAVKCAIDMAAWDLAARLAGVSLADMMGGSIDGEIPLYRSIGQADPDTMAEDARRFIDQGYTRLQVKTGADPVEDVERLKAVQSAVPAGTPLYADANGGWSLEEALRFVDATRDLDYRLEQPCMAYTDNLQISRRCAKPMILDEGITCLEDLLRAHTDGVIAGVTLKMSRLGGLTKTRLLRDVAVSLGLKVTIEDTGGSTINTAITAHMMASTPTTHRAHTVDFMNWVTVQNAEGMPQTRDGMLIMPEGVGCGVGLLEPSSD